VITGECHERAVEPDQLVDSVQEFAHCAVGPDCDIPHLRRFRAIAVADGVVRRETHREHVDGVPPSELLVIQ
jgi:hypothetical protein